MSHVWLWFKTSSLKVYFQPKFEGSKCTFRSSVKVVVINSLFVSGIQEVNCFLEIHIWDSWKICCRDHFWSLLLTGIQEINLYFVIPIQESQKSLQMLQDSILKPWY